MVRVAIVGAGLAGLTAAYRLQQAGHQVEVFERYPRPGGLARVTEVGGERLELFYHHLFTTDTAYMALAAELGLADQVEWLPSRMGIWADGRLWDFGTPSSLLAFSPLDWVSKLRFAATTLWLQRRSRPEPYEGITAAAWIRRHQGAAAYRAIWEPLLKQKFAEMAEDVAMVWLWGKIHLRGRSRSSSGLGERLGYMRGSFARLVERLAELVREMGGGIHLADAVKRIDVTENGGFRVVSRHSEHLAERVIVAAPVPDYLAIAGHLVRASDRHELAALRATGALCTVLEMDRSLTPYYWLNIADPEMPFGGLIEHTNYIPAARYGGRVVLYISNYLFPDHPLFTAPKQVVLGSYFPALQRINPAFDPSWVREVHHVRADYAQPVVTTGYRQHIPDFRTPVPGMYLCSMAQIFPEDRGQNYAVAYAEKVARMLHLDVHAAS